MRRAVGLAALLAVLLAASSQRGQTQTEISGRIFPADGVVPQGVWVQVRAGLLAESVPVDSTGEFIIRLPQTISGEDTVELRVVARGSRDYIPSRARMRADELAGRHGFVLIPRRWTVSAGAHAGRAVPISMRRAFTPACEQCSSFYIHPTIFTRSRRDVPVQRWPDDKFPLRVAFDRERSEVAITERDSVAFWRIAERLELDVGRRLFRPARYEETLPGEDEDEPEDVILVWVDPSLPYAGVGFAVSQGGTIIHGVVRLKRGASFTGAEGASLVTHELVHALGWGHTCSWRSAAAEIRFCPELRSPGVTPEDVAYAEVLRAVQTLQREHAARWGIEAALAGES